MADGYVSEPHSEGISNSLLAISFCSQYADDESFVPMNINLTGSTVCKFCFPHFFSYYFSNPKCIVSNYIGSINLLLDQIFLQAGFCNLIKRPKDQINHLWVAEATENTSYFLNFDSTDCSHMKNAAVSAKRWAENSTSVCTLLLYS